MDPILSTHAVPSFPIFISSLAGGSLVIDLLCLVLTRPLAFVWLKTLLTWACVVSSITFFICQPFVTPALKWLHLAFLALQWLPWLLHLMLSFPALCCFCGLTSSPTLLIDLLSAPGHLAPNASSTYRALLIAAALPVTLVLGLAATAAWFLLGSYLFLFKLSCLFTLDHVWGWGWNRPRELLQRAVWPTTSGEGDADAGTSEAPGEHAWVLSSGVVKHMPLQYLYQLLLFNVPLLAIQVRGVGFSHLGV